jgi:MFS family permease
MKTNRYKELIYGIFHRFTAPHNRNLVLFTIEGTLITLINYLIGYNNNLFATRLGANDYQLSLVTTLPQLVGMLVLIPGGILTDRMKNKRSMVVIALSALTVCYIMIGFVPMLGSNRLIAFLLVLALSTGPMTIYTASWQAYFSDVVPIEERNKILTSRTAFTFLMGIIIPLGSGALLASATSVDDKIKIHQVYFWLAGILLLTQIFVLLRIKGKQGSTTQKIRLMDLKFVFHDLIQNKKFLGFIFVALYFYVTWHVDWTIYFISQVNYLKLNEAWLSYISIGNALMQFITLRFWSRMNVKRGVRFGIIFGSLGLVGHSLAMIIATSVPLPQGKIIFLILYTLASFAMPTIMLNILQCLLQVIPERNKTLNISIYTVLVTLSNAFMPLVGVSIYNRLGSNLQALHTIFWALVVLRLIAVVLWTLRWYLMRKEA